MRERGKQPRWTAMEDETVRQAWDAGGLRDGLAWLPHRSPESINKRAQYLGLSRYDTKNKPESLSPLQPMDSAQLRECARLNDWRYPVSGQLVGWRLA